MSSSADLASWLGVTTATSASGVLFAELSGSLTGPLRHNTFFSVPATVFGDSHDAQVRRCKFFLESEGPARQIDKLDLHILQLLNKRAAIAGQIGKVKADQGGEVFSAAREEE